MGWGDHGHARAVTKEYSDGYDRLFNKSTTEDKGKASEIKEKETLQLKGMATGWCRKLCLYAKSFLRV